jgi:hypothetical protein
MYAIECKDDKQVESLKTRFKHNLGADENHTLLAELDNDEVCALQAEGVPVRPATVNFKGYTQS